MSHSVNILLIEDCPDDALLFRLGLGKSDATVTHVTDAQQAIEVLATNSLPDIIVLDLVLPGMSVSKFLKWVRANPPIQQIPMVILTGAVHVDEEVKADVLRTFFKSSDPVDLRATVSTICALAQANKGILAERCGSQ